MEAATGVVMRQVPLRFSSCCHSATSSSELRTSVFMGRRRATRGAMFCDKGHLQYYCSPKNSSVAIRNAEQGEMVKEKKDGVKKVMKVKKKQLKLLKGLSKDLSTFSMMGYGLDSDRALVDQIKGNSISEAAELLLEQLNRIRAREKELKRKDKKEKARLKAAAKMQDTSRSQSSSSSSSESSDSDCGEVINMKKLKNAQAKPNSVQQVIEEHPSSSHTTPVITTVTPLQPDTTEQKPTLQSTSLASGESSCCSEASTTSTSYAIAKLTDDSAGSVVSMTSSKKIEVCMGGKCKKSGATALLDEFQRVVGIEGAVSGCKCMGKCRDAPNVKVQSGDSDKSVRAPTSSLCLGVGLEDVELIVANLLGSDNDNQLGFAAAS